MIAGRCLPRSANPAGNDPGGGKGEAGRGEPGTIALHEGGRQAFRGKARRLRRSEPPPAIPAARRPRPSPGRHRGAPNKRFPIRSESAGKAAGDALCLGRLAALPRGGLCPLARRGRPLPCRRRDRFCGVRAARKAPAGDHFPRVRKSPVCPNRAVGHERLSPPFPRIISCARSGTS